MATICTVSVEHAVFSILAIRHTILICRHAAGAFIDSGPRVPTRNVQCSERGLI